MKRIIPMLLGLSMAYGASASDWNFETFINASLIHTDNVGLTQGNAAQSDSIVLLSPQFNLTRESARVTMDLSYNPQAVFYDKADDANQVFHVLDGTMTAELAKERLFVDVSAAKFQTIVTPEGSFPIDNIPASNNRADSTVLTVNPYWQQRFGNSELRIDVAHTRVDLDDESVDTQFDLQSNQSNTAGFRLGTRRQQQTGMTWALDYNYERLEYDDAIPWEYQRGSGQLGVWVNDAVRLFGTYGVETPFDDFLSGQPDDAFWEGGVEYAPNSRLNLVLAAGERSFGGSVRAAMTYNTQRSQTTLSYQENPETQGGLLPGRRPLRDIDNLDGLLDRAGDSDRLIRKRGEIATTVTLPKSTINWRIFNERRTDRTTAEGAPLPGEDLNGAAFRFEWRFGARTSVNLTADVARRTGGLQDGDFWRSGIGFTYAVSSRMTLSLNLQHVEQDGGIAGVGGGAGFNYDENRGTLTVGMRL